MRIALCRPVRDQLDHVHQRCVDALARYLQEAGDELIDCSVFGIANVDRARAFSAGRALAAGAEAMIWTDADIIFSAADANRMLVAAMLRRAVVGGLYSTKQRRGAIVGCGLPAELKAYAEGDLVPVRAVGFGLVAIPMAVFLRVCEGARVPRLKIEGLDVFAAWLPFPIGDEYPTDDTCFCERAAAAGVAVLADTRARVLHAGRYEYALEDTVGVPGRLEQLTIQVRRAPANGSPPLADTPV